MLLFPDLVGFTIFFEAFSLMFLPLPEVPRLLTLTNNSASIGFKFLEANNLASDFVGIHLFLTKSLAKGDLRTFKSLFSPLVV